MADEAASTQPGATDLRRSIDGLAALVRQRFDLDPRSGHLGLFRNRRGGSPQILAWDHGGLRVLYKQLERGTFARPRDDNGDAVPLRSGDLRLARSRGGVIPAAAAGLCEIDPRGGVQCGGTGEPLVLLTGYGASAHVFDQLRRASVEEVKPLAGRSSAGPLARRYRALRASSSQN